MDEETFELPLNELQLDTGETHYSANWHGYAVRYIRPAWSKSEIHGELCVEGTGQNWLAFEVRLRDREGIIQRKPVIVYDEEAAAFARPDD